MTDLTDAELDALEWAHRDRGEDHILCDRTCWESHPCSVVCLIAEVRRWRDQAADEAGLARLAAEIGRLAESVDHLGRKGPGGWEGYGEMDASPGWPGGATAAKGDGDE